MIFAKRSHTLVFGAAIVAMVAFLADRDGAISALASQSHEDPGKSAEASAEVAEAPPVVEQAPMVSDDAAFADDVEMDEPFGTEEFDPMPDNMGEDIYNPDDGAFGTESSDGW
ncbi:hypothetical protein [Alteraurantiacibacter palmitatis]|uniref:Uncharacterized protein n=1 Tax=Alteraurantiacibacter palmitatis TaxID=2054628 RepID=A0ABV7EA24_9SPHN